MNIPFNYQVLSVDEAARCMEVVFTSPGRTPVHVGVRIPNKGETLDAVVFQYAPWSIWLESETELAEVEVGARGSFTPEAPLSALAQARQDKLQEIAEWRYYTECAGILVDGFKVGTDRETRALLADAQANLERGVMDTVNWKGLDGQWKTFDAEGLAQVRAEVFAYVQGCFNAEAALVELVNQATAVEEIRAIELPELVLNGAA